jgi:TATA-box binding protein (TBP) (component of TFIID and TFIIIB)
MNRGEMGEEKTTAMRGTITNVFGKCDFGCDFNLRDLAIRLRNTAYAPKKNPALKIEYRSPNGVVQLFKSGRATLTGARTIENAKAVFGCLHRSLRRVLKRELPSFAVSITNIQASADYGHCLCIESLAKNYPKQASYEPEIKASVEFTMAISERTVKAQIFATGKLRISKAAKESDVSAALLFLDTILPSYKLDATTIAERA